MLKVTSISLQPVDFADSAVAFQNGVILERYKNVMNISFSKVTSRKRIQIAPSSGGNSTITNINSTDFQSFLTDDDFMESEQIKLDGATVNTGAYSIVSITDKVITVSGTLSNETIEVCYIYVTSVPDALEFYYNLIGNNESESYLSKTDQGVLQKYICSGLNAVSGTVVPLKIGTSSNAWVTDTLTGITSNSTVKVNGATGAGQTYQQTFTITHYFSVAPFFLKEQLPNFLQKNPPSYFSGASIENGIATINGLQYICLFNIKYNSTDVAPAYVGNYMQGNGVSSWFNQSNERTIPEFYVDSIAYEDTNSNPLSSIDFSKDVNVTIKIKSNSGLFVNYSIPGTGTKFIVKHIYCPLDSSSYQNTLTTLLQNFMYDQAIQNIGNPVPVNGLNYGGNYQVIKNVLSTLQDANNATITFTVSYATFLKSILLSKSSSDRNFSLSITIE